MAHRKSLPFTFKSTLLSFVVISTISLGYMFPLLGFVVPIVMLTGFVVSLFRGRYTCGNLCPRGAFFDTVIARFSSDREIPRFVRSKLFRWSAFALMMGFMIFRIAQNPASVNHWGAVFWSMCVYTTFIGIIGAAATNSRFWCSFCPMGTVQQAVGGSRNLLEIDGSVCRECRLCEKACPMNLEIVSHKDKGFSPERDCIKCGRCSAVCPKNALEIPHAAKSVSETFRKAV
ncbi:MAG: 4Fe-4S binding protein [Chitinispirillaceae bacterium]